MRMELFLCPAVFACAALSAGRTAAERIIRHAFELARQGGRRLVTFCHKADVLPLSDGLFLANEAFAAFVAPVGGGERQPYGDGGPLPAAPFKEPA